MYKYSLSLAVFLLGHYGILQAHVVDIHIPTASEIAAEQRREEQREKDKAWETYQDEDTTEEERAEAFETLVEKEEIV